MTGWIRNRWFRVAVLPTLLVGIIVLVVLWKVSASSSISIHGPSTVVVRGPLVVSITEAGELEAARKTVISNELRWPVIIKSVVPEGTIVKPGQVIIQFECKELTEAIERQKIALTNAQNDYTQASENLALLKEEAANMVRKAEQAVLNAQENLRRYEEGEWPVRRGEAQSAIQIARRDLTLAQARLDFKLKVNKDPELNSPYSANEIEADKLAVARLKLALEKAISEQEMLIKYDHPRQLRSLRTALSDAQLELKRAKLEARTKLRIAQTKAQTAKATLDMQKAKLDDLLEQYRKLVVKADRGGLVVYRTSSNPWRQAEVTVEVGQKINPRQRLMIIPDLSSLEIKTRVYEAMINQIQEGMKSPQGIKAYIRLDARPDLKLTGKVWRVAPLPDTQHRWLNPGVKVFSVIVKFDRQVKGLKPGMTAQVELVLARLEDVLSVPIAAVFTEQDKTYCWRIVGGRPEKVEVKVGRMNDRRVQIVSGLNQGDRILLSPPTVSAVKGKQVKPAKPSPAGRARPLRRNRGRRPRRRGT